VPLAHRGLHGGGVPENSLAAFAAAAEAGYGIELDVRLTLDRIPVVLHDAQLARVTGQGGRVRDLRYEDLARRRLRGSQEHVPTLDEVLRLVAGRVPVMVEIKSHLSAARISPAVADVLDVHQHEICVASFNPRALAWFRRHRPQVPRVLTASSLHGMPLPRVVRRRLARLRQLALLQPAAVSYELAGLPSPVTDRWRQLGGVLVAWTVRDTAALERARDLADNVIFERVRP
jgi:glycerophosphoryl diester phosphodiesterase